MFIAKDDRLPDGFFMRMGGLKSRGFGLCRLSKETVIKQPEIREGIPRTRIREDQLENFAIKKLDPVVYGYLFKPTSEVDGVYCRYLFEGSRVEGYSGPRKLDTKKADLIREAVSWFLGLRVTKLPPRKRGRVKRVYRTVHLPAEHADRIRALAERNNVSNSYVVEYAVQQYFFWNEGLL